MGSDTNYLTVEETAHLLGVKPSAVHHMNRKRLLDAHYPNGSTGGKHFLREDVFSFSEIRENAKEGFTAKLPDLAIRAAIASRRVERKLDELHIYLGMTEERLKLDAPEVKTFYDQILELIKTPDFMNDEAVLRWARKILSIDEDYLELVARVTSNPEPWRVYGAFTNALLSVAADDRIRAYVEHARRNLRNAAYFYERGLHGPRVAKQKFAGETYAGKLMKAIFPI